jgi:hypothetical protein
MKWKQFCPAAIKGFVQEMSKIFHDNFRMKGDAYYYLSLEKTI